MKLTVLGRYGPFPAPGGACSSYLVEAPMEVGKSNEDCPTVKIVLDLGAGTLTRLISFCSLHEISAIFLSHLHSDHMSDMLVLRYALQQLHARGMRVPTPLHVIAPELPEAEFRMLASAGTFNMIKAEDNLKLHFGTLSITLKSGIHPVPSYSMDIVEDIEKGYPVYGKVTPRPHLFYTGDTGYHAGLERYAKHAGILLADAGLIEKDASLRIAAHLTAGEAGKIARNAGVGKLLLSHLWGGGVDEEKMLNDAKAYFKNSEIAKEMSTYTVT